ncbi:hypothetical protein NUW54_g9326 [Trametes sanguinea]|uniref:Uncharacterized protein n=1 Tax=Trametes sanguinea TaxID=158606 RepID=A0ACC1P7C8_9APHY|nr:hypothetical protein NUW54_g9326 [Trametes sanguinea]
MRRATTRRPARTVSPAHTDPFYNFYGAHALFTFALDRTFTPDLAQVVGRKTIWLAPPEASPYMYPYPSVGSSSSLADDTDHRRNPAANQESPSMSNTSRVDVFATGDDIRGSKDLFSDFWREVPPMAMQVTLERGDLLFFPPASRNCAPQVPAAPGPSPRDCTDHKEYTPCTQRQIHTYTEGTLQKACEHLDANPGATYDAVASLFNVPRSTLYARHKGLHSSRRGSHHEQQLLTPEEEEALCDWLDHISAEGLPADKDTVCEMVQAITGQSARPNRKWVYRFLARHPQIRLGRPSGLAPERAQAFNRTNVADHFAKLKELIKRYKIPWNHIYNMDEKGIQVGGHGRIRKIKYFVRRGRRTNYKIRSSSLELVTVVECVCADGSTIQPGIIFSGERLSTDIFMNASVDPHVCISVSPNGWTSNFHCLEWFRQCFIPQATSRRTSDAPLLLILDGHPSHVTPEMRQLALDNNVHIFLLPPHTTHRLQPLDVGIFAHLEHKWRAHCDQYFKISGGEDMQRAEFVRHYLEVRNATFTEDLVRKAWRDSGITPTGLHAGFFSEEDYAPSHVSSTRAHVPPTYPTKHPLFEEHAMTVAGESASAQSSGRESNQDSIVNRDRSNLRERARLRRHRSISAATSATPGNDSSSAPHHCRHRMCPQCQLETAGLREHVSALEEELDELSFSNA